VLDGSASFNVNEVCVVLATSLICGDLAIFRTFAIGVSADICTKLAPMSSTDGR